jgi:hypothetical protein
MNYVYKNITTTAPVILINSSQSKSGITTIHKCQIANVDSTSAAVDIYIEKYNLNKTVEIHGSLENGNVDSEGNYLNKIDRQVFYQIKNVNIPTGTTLSLFTDHACRHGSEFQLVIESTQNVDVILDYEQSSVRSAGVSRNINQY